MEAKKINQLATEMSPAASDLTIIGDPITGVSKKITLEQISSLFSSSISFYTNYAAFPATGNVDTLYCAKDTNKLYLWDGSAYVQTFPSQALLDTYQLRSEKGAVNGYASLDGSGKVPVSQLPSSIMEYKGMWSAATNTPTLANGTGDTGDVYICNAAGTVNFGAGAITFAVGDYVIYSGSIWQRSSGAVGTVTSVAVTESSAALSITGSPITTSGTINIGFAGTSAQYVAGDGSLVTFPSLTGYVPYTGATTNVDLGEFELKAGQLTLDTSPTGTASVGTTRWNDTTGITETTLKGGNVILKNGVDLVARVVNKVSPNTTLTKAAYPAVRVSGAQGQRLAVAYAQANNDNNSADTIGLVIETIATNQEGFIMTVGQLEGVNTTGSLQGETWVDGDVLYLSPSTAGALTNIKPTGSSGHIVVMGYVEYSHAINGKIYVKIMNGWELDELHNVYISSVANNQGLFYESSTSLWKNKSIATVLGYTPANDASVVHLAGNETITGLKTFNTPVAFDNALNVKFDASITAFGGYYSIYAIKGVGSGNSTLALYDGDTNKRISLSFYNSSDYTYLFPAASGTVALTSQLTSGTVTSVGLSSSTSGVTIGSSPVTTSGTITLSIATASGSQQGLLSSTDWTTFNSKQGAITLTTTGTSGAATLVGNTLNIPQYQAAGTYVTSVTGTSPIVSSGGTTPAISINQATTSTSGYLSSTDWNTFNNKQNALTNPVTGTGTSGQVTYFNGTSSISGSNNLKFDGINLSIGNPSSALAQLHVYNASAAASILLQTNSTTDYSEIAVRNDSSTATSYFRQYSTAATGSDFGISRAGLALFFSNYATNFAIGTRNGGNLIFGTADTERARIDTSGNFGIGTASPSYKLDVNGTGRFTGALNGTSATFSGVVTLNAYGNQLKIGSNGATDSFIGQGSGQNNLFIGDYNTATKGLTINVSTGAATFSSSVTASSVGIGTSPIGAFKLSIQGDDSGQALRLRNTTTRYRSDFGVANSGELGINCYDDTAATYMPIKIEGSKISILQGNVGIGTSSPNALLQVLGSSIIGSGTISNGTTFGGGNQINRLKVETGAYTCLEINGATSGGSIQFTYGSNLPNQVGGLIGYNYASGGDKGMYISNVLDGVLAFATNNSERMRITSAGNVGIGGTVPNTWNSIFRVLEIGTLNSSIYARTDGYDQLFLGTNHYYSTGGAYIYANSGKPAQRFYLYNGDFVFQNAPSGTAGNAITWATPMTLTSAGNVGIGTSSPDTLLHIAGTQGTLKVASNSTSGANAPYLSFFHAGNDEFKIVGGGYLAFLSSGTTERMRITSGGYVGIGTSSPVKPLQVNSSYSLEVVQVNNTRNGGSNDYGLVTLLGSNDNNTSNYHYIAATGGADKCYIYGNGNIVNTNGSYGTLSDATLKENIIDANPKLNDLLQIKVRNFNLIDDENKTKQIGFIAQEFEEVFPTMVDTDGKTGMKTIKTSVLVPMLVKAIQEQQKQIDELKTKIK